jgi:hypothetical protein
MYPNFYEYYNLITSKQNKNLFGIYALFSEYFFKNSINSVSLPILSRIFYTKVVVSSYYY